MSTNWGSWVLLANNRDHENCPLYGVAGCPLFRGCLSTEVNERIVGTFRIVRYIMSVRLSVKRGSTVLTKRHKRLVEENRQNIFLCSKLCVSVSPGCFSAYFTKPLSHNMQQKLHSHSIHLQVCQQSAVLEFGVRVGVREQRKIKRRSKALLSLWWQSWTSLKAKLGRSLGGAMLWSQDSIEVGHDTIREHSIQCSPYCAPVPFWLLLLPPSWSSRSETSPAWRTVHPSVLSPVSIGKRKEQR